MRFLRRFAMGVLALPFFGLAIIGIFWTVDAVSELVRRDVITLSGLGDILGSMVVAGLGIVLGSLLAAGALRPSPPSAAA